MSLSIKARTIFWFLVIALCIYAAIIVFFAWLYYSTQSIGYVESAVSYTERIDFLRAAYFSVVSFHTIGYGDLYPVSHQGRLILMTQSFISLYYTAVFSGLLVYFIIKRHADIFTTKHLYIRIWKDKWFLSIRVGNRSRPIIGLTAKFEAWTVHDNSRVRVFTSQAEMADLEHILYLDFDLEDPQYENLLGMLVKSFLSGPVIHMKYNFIGNDIRTGEQVAHSVYYDTTRIRFGKSFMNVYSWDEKGRRKGFRWRNFERIDPLEDFLIEKFKRGRLDK